MIGWAEAPSPLSFSGAYAWDSRAGVCLCSQTGKERERNRSETLGKVKGRGIEKGNRVRDGGRLWLGGCNHVYVLFVWLVIRSGSHGHVTECRRWGLRLGHSRTGQHTLFLSLHTHTHKQFASLSGSLPRSTMALKQGMCFLHLLLLSSPFSPSFFLKQVLFYCNSIRMRGFHAAEG